MLQLVNKGRIWQWILAICILFITNSCKDEVMNPYDICYGYDFQAQAVADDKMIQEYMKANNITDTVKTASGLYYQVISAGTGAKPTAGQRVKVHYVGKLIQNSYKFDSSYDRGMPATFGVNDVIKGWQEGLTLMRVGERARLFIPSELAYGCRGSYPSIPSGAPLVFEVDLLEIVQ